jgi:hypothetical protein
MINANPTDRPVLDVERLVLMVAMVESRLSDIPAIGHRGRSAAAMCPG